MIHNLLACWLAKFVEVVVIGVASGLLWGLLAVSFVLAVVYGIAVVRGEREL